MKLVCSIMLPVVAIAAPGVDPTMVLAEDDECNSQDGGSNACAMNALQVRSRIESPLQASTQPDPAQLAEVTILRMPLGRFGVRLKQSELKSHKHLGADSSLACVIPSFMESASAVLHVVHKAARAASPMMGCKRS